MLLLLVPVTTATMVAQGQIVIIGIILLGATGRSEGGGGTRVGMRVAISIIKMPVTYYQGVCIGGVTWSTREYWIVYSRASMDAVNMLVSDPRLKSIEFEEYP